MIFGFIVGGLIGGICFAAVEAALINTVSHKTRKVISWSITIILFGIVRSLIQ